jgi:hypothetical protein
MSAPFWTSDMVAELARLRREGRTARQIADALSARFRVAVSRSAVCGLVYRLNQAAAGERAPRAPRPSARRSQAGRLAKPGPRWTAQEDATLRRLRDEGLGLAAIAAAMGRPVQGVSARVSRLGIGVRPAVHPGLEHWATPAQPTAPAAPAGPPEDEMGDPFWASGPMVCGEVLEDGAICQDPPKRGSIWCAACAARFKVAPIKPRLSPPRDSTRVSARRVIKAATGWERWL